MHLPGPSDARLPLPVKNDTMSKREHLPFPHDVPGLDAESLKHSLVNRLLYSIGKDPNNATDRDWLYSLAYTLRERLIDRWQETLRKTYREDAKRIYYLSMEYLVGRTLTNTMLNLHVEEEIRKILLEMGLSQEKIAELEPDAALGNGGLGRLAACFLDSMATLDLPGFGYGIRYEFGMFTQRIEGGRQVEHPDNWLRYGNPWEFPRPELLYPVRFYGRVVSYQDENGQTRYSWVDTRDVMAMAYDTPVPGYNTETVNNLRLWSAKASRDFDLEFFNEGNYLGAVEDKYESETLSKVLYPSDKTYLGRALRLKQEYFFISASIQDILRRFKKTHDNWDLLPQKAAIQLNDTHPVLAIGELMRLLLDQYRLEWEQAWRITEQVFSYTNHTLMPEALETWEVQLIETMLPRHMQIIYEINHRFLARVQYTFPGDMDLLRRVSIIDEEHGRRVRMANLAIVGSHKVNGVAAIHSRLMQEFTFADFYRVFPEKFTNITNGITPRLWLNQANPLLAHLVNQRIGGDWVTDLPQLRALQPLAEDPHFQQAFAQIKRHNKARLAHLIKHHLNIDVLTDSLFDVQIKRIHEYKRQLLNVLHVITLYNRIRAGERIVPRTVIFAGKAAPSYVMAKLIIRLIHDVATIVNHDPVVQDQLKVVFIPNYDVSTALDIIPAADLSEQISTAGTEASGTGNMKLALNGALTIGTLDGANVEIREAVGEDNIFIFGLTADEAHRLQQDGYTPRDYYHNDPALRQVLDMIGQGFFAPDEPDRYAPVVQALLDGGDRYLLLADYASYVATQEAVSALYRDPAAWTRKAILNVAAMGHFSSDRAIQEYADKIWNVKPLQS